MQAPIVCLLLGAAGAVVSGPAAAALPVLALPAQDTPQEPAPPASAPAYDPLALPEGAAPPPSLTLTAHDAARQRDLPLRVWLPSAAKPTSKPTSKPAPVVLFSHGLGGNRDGCSYLGAHWSRRGYAVVYVQHPGSDDGVWKDVPARERLAAMERAASAQNLLLRAQDVRAVLDRLAEWNADADHPCHGRLDLERVGMSGHSFGAITTQVVSGQSAARGGPRLCDARIDAALAMSPSAPRAGDAKRAFAAVSVPWLLMTGTRDDAPIGGQTVQSRREVYPALPATIDRFELVLDGAEHSAFGERALPGDREPRNPNHHRAILALSTAFWDAYLRGDPDARAWLFGEGPRAVLQERDGWQGAERAAGSEPARGR